MAFSDAFARVYGVIQASRARNREDDMQEQLLPLQKEALYSQNRLSNMQARLMRWQAQQEASDPFYRLRQAAPLAQAYAQLSDVKQRGVADQQRYEIAVANLKEERTKRMEAQKVIQEMIGQQKAERSDMDQAADQLVLDLDKRTGFSMPASQAQAMRNRFAGVYKEMFDKYGNEELAAKAAMVKFQQDYGQNMLDLLGGNRQMQTDNASEPLGPPAPPVQAPAMGGLIGTVAPMAAPVGNYALDAIEGVARGVAAPLVGYERSGYPQWQEEQRQIGYNRAKGLIESLFGPYQLMPPGPVDTGLWPGLKVGPPRGGP